MMSTKRNEKVEFDIENTCRACLRTELPLRSVEEVAVDGLTFESLIVRVCLHFEHNFIFFTILEFAS